MWIQSSTTSLHLYCDETVVHATVASHLDYCLNSLIGLPASTPFRHHLLSPKQSLKTVAKESLQTKSDHVTFIVPLFLKVEAKFLQHPKSPA